MYLNDLDNYSLISNETPLISNLDIIENIALIKEVHEKMSVKKAEGLAKVYLEDISLESIARKRPSSCSDLEKFYVKVIRACMSKDERIVILTPFSLIKDTMDIKKVVADMKKLDIKKTILVLDIKNNEILYKGLAWNIVK